MIEILQAFGLGALGGALVELLRWWQLREVREFPVYTSKLGYWIITGLMIAAGGVVATLYGLGLSNPAALVNLGASTPAILGALAAKTGPRDRALTGPGLGEKSFDEATTSDIQQSKLVRKFIAFGNVA
jgi:hypothetical protein